MAFSLIGLIDWEADVDNEGYRVYKGTFRCQGSSLLDGPALALQTPGLPSFGSVWAIGNDLDIWAWRRHETNAKPVEKQDRFFDVTCTFSTKPPDTKRCSEIQVEDPLLQPPKISGTFAKYQKEAVVDRFNEPIKTSSHEQVRGPQVEFDANRPQVKIEMNVASFDTISLAYSLLDTVNDATLWGFNARCVKLSNCTWEQKFYGVCFKYYTVTLEFDVRTDTFDRDVPDEGTKALRGQFKADGVWQLLPVSRASDGAGGYIYEYGDADNPSHFDRFKDRSGNTARTFLNGAGLPASVSYGTMAGTGSSGISGGPAKIHVEYYPEADLTTLGIPLAL